MTVIWRDETNFGQQHGLLYPGRCATRMCVHSYFVPQYKGLWRIGAHGPKSRDGGWISMMDSHLYLVFVLLMTFWFSMIQLEDAVGVVSLLDALITMLDKNRFGFKCVENNHFHNRNTATRPHHDPSWTHHCCKRHFWSTQMVGSHVCGTWLWECWCVQSISFASCCACFPFKRIPFSG